MILVNVFSWVVGSSLSGKAYLSEVSALRAVFVELTKRDEGFSFDEWNFWRSKLGEVDRQVLSFILERGAVNGVLPDDVVKLFVDHYNSCADVGDRFKVVKLEICGDV